MDSSSHNSINILPEFLVNQIKAGEVVERPASLLKELVENSIDAGSTKIEIHIIDNGLELVSVIDNGKGMTYDELPFAFCRHATSKIENLEDLYKLSSFGFRGEALASISSISRLTCTSTTKNHDGGKITIHGSKQISHLPLKNNKSGTSLFIKDLFYNTPVRLKFIKSKNSEKNALKKTIQSFLLSSPNVTFVIKWDSKEKEIFKNVELNNFHERVKKVFFKKSEDKKLISIKYQYENYHVEGLLSENSSKGHSNKSQFLFVNERFFSDKTIHSLIIRTMNKIWPEGTAGHYIIKLTIPPHHLDVNVHPRKTQIKFLKSSLVYSLISSGLKKTLLETIPSIPSPQLPPEENVSKNEDLPTYENLKNHHENGPFTISLTPQFLLMKTENKTFRVIDKSRLFLNYCIFNYNQEFPIKEESITPLLISEPFSLGEIKIPKSSLRNLQDFGIDLEYLEKETLILRSIPQFIEKLPYKNFIESLIKSLSKSEVQQDINNLESRKKFFQKNYDIFLENFNWSSYEIGDDFEVIRCVEKIEGPCLTSYKDLTNNTLESFFNLS